MTYRKADAYRRVDRYRPPLPFVGDGYRKSAPYTKPRSYRGNETVPGVVRPAEFGAVSVPITAAPAAAPAPLWAGWVQVAARLTALAARWNERNVESDTAVAPWSVPTAGTGAATLPFGDFARDADEIAAPWAAPAPFERGSAVAFADFEEPRADAVAAPWSSPAACSGGTSIAFGEITRRIAASLSAFWREAAHRGGSVALPWGPMGARRNDTTIDWPVQPSPHPDTITVPFLPVYTMIPNIEVVLLPDRVPLNVVGLSVQSDLASWAWTFTAQLPFAELALVSPTAGEPPKIEISVNGYVWTMLVEGHDDNRRFGARTATLRGRSPSALLAGPYAPARTFTETAARTIAQLADQELADTGWTLHWDAVSWLVPANVFSYQDLTPMDAIGRLASAIGAAVLTSPATQEITVQPTYPISPWAWPEAVPYALLPASILASGDGAWQGGPNATGVYVYSENAGYGALVKLAGTDGARQVPMVVESLAVSADPARERGRHELAKAGRIKTETRTIPLFPAPAPPGLIPLGKLLEVSDGDAPADTWRGQLTGVRVEARRNGRAVTVRQVLSIERQFR